MFAWIAMLVLAVVSLSSSYIESTTLDPVASVDTASPLAEHLSMYRGWVQKYEQDTESLTSGTIADSSLPLPGGMTMPSFDHHARIGDDGNVYVWSNEGGALYAASSEVIGSAALCHVISTRQCVSALSDRATLSAAQTPNFIPTGSTVYVWQR